MTYEPPCPRCGEGQELYQCADPECDAVWCDDCASPSEVQMGMCRDCLDEGDDNETYA